MKRPIQFLLLFSLIVSTPGYSHATWSSDDIKKAGIVAAGAAALLYLFGGSSETGQGDMYPSDYGVDDFSYSENESSSFSSDFFAQQKQPAFQQSGPLINLSSLLCLGVLSYFGYNYLKNDDDQSNDATEKKTVSAQNQIKESQAPVKEKASYFKPTVAEGENGGEGVQVQIEQTIWQSMKTTVWQYATKRNIPLATVFFAAATYSVYQGYQGPEVAHGAAHERIIKYYQRAQDAQAAICENIKAFEHEGFLSKQQATILSALATELLESIGSYRDLSRGKACYRTGAYKPQISEGAMQQILLWQSKAGQSYKELLGLELASSSGFAVSNFANELLERSEHEGVVLTGHNSSETSKQHEPVVGTTKREEGQPLEVKDSMEKKLELADGIKNKGALFEVQTFSNELVGEEVTRSSSSQPTLEENAETKSSESEDDIVKGKKTEPIRSLDYDYSYADDYGYEDVEDMQNEMRMDSLHD